MQEPVFALEQIVDTPIVTTNEWLVIGKPQNPRTFYSTSRHTITPHHKHLAIMLPLPATLTPEQPPFHIPPTPIPTTP